jgi:hypothetical protein
MFGRNSHIGMCLIIAGLSFIVRCSAAAAQGALPPPTVSVTPVVIRDVTETGNFIGRVTAINKVDEGVWRFASRSYHYIWLSEAPLLGRSFPLLARSYPSTTPEPIQCPPHFSTTTV